MRKFATKISSRQNSVNQYFGMQIHILYFNCINRIRRRKGRLAPAPSASWSPLSRPCWHKWQSATCKFWIKGKNLTWKEPVTLEDSVDCSFTDAVSFGKRRAVPMYKCLFPDVADVHGPPPLVSVHLHVAAHGYLVFWLAYLVFWLAYLVFWLAYLIFWLAYLVFWLAYLVFWLTYLVFWSELQKAFKLAQALFSPKKLAQIMRK